ncbi:MAG: hypothetical protein Q8L37_05620, partial [Candidatus Gottesmanbacteria bacterium]|nr:hypothetical protein [Candidatus Gottesmanbacteria bacterium]
TGLISARDLTLGLNDTTATISTTDANEDLTIDPNGTGDIYFHSTSYYIDDTGNAVAATFKDSADTAYYLDPAASGTALKINGNIELTAGGTIASTSNADITIDAGAGTVIIGDGTGKLNAGTLDPPYTINGKKYATYVPSMVGIKEELSGSVYTSTLVPGVGYRTTVHFEGQPEGSDLWLFSKVTALKKNIGQLVVLLSPAGNTRSWYEVDEQNVRLTIFTSKPTTVSYRLSGPRFDADQWQNTRDDSSRGHVIDDPDSAPRADAGQALDQTGYLSGVSLTLVKETNDQGTSVWNLKDTLGNTIEEFLSVSQATIANLTAGSINVQELVAKSIDVGSLTIGGKTISEYIRDIIRDEQSVINTQQSPIISPIASDSAGISVKLGDSQTFGIYNKEGTPSATFDTLGNATLSGSLVSSVLRSNEVTTNQLTTHEASIAGTLYADRIVTRFGDLDERLRSVEASISATPATPSSQLLTTDYLLPTTTLDATSSALLALLSQDVAAMKSDSFDYAQDKLYDQLIDGTILIDKTGISTISDTLYIQPAKLGNLDIMGGAIVINTLGDVVITGNLAVSGNLIIGGVLGINIIRPINGFGDLIFDATGSALFTGDIIASGSGIFRDLVVSASASGTLVIGAGESIATVSGTLVTGDAMLSVTPTWNTTVWVATKAADFFTLRFGTPPTSSASADWLIVRRQ